MIRSFPLIRGHRNAGVALLVTLSAVVLLTALILAFFSKSLLNRQISYSNTNVLKADQLARSSLEIVTGELRQEIADPSYSSLTNNGGNLAYPVFYRPLAPGDAIPQKVGISGAATTNLFKISTANNSAIDPGANGRAMGSPVLISQPSLNGRLLSLDRWFGSGGPSFGTNSTLPAWVYVTRAGIQTPVLTTVADPAQSGYAIGRFAYTVYDIGGLMDANVAGYPALASNIAPFKSSLAFADIGNVLGITGLAPWRNAATGVDTNTFTEWAVGLPLTATTNAGAMSAAASGHLSAVGGDNVFFSRRDLLLAAQKGIAGLTPAQAGALTHFSRALNAPSWAPATISAANPDLLSLRFPAAATITHYDNTSLASTYPVLAGDPLLQHRFSLAKVGWITASGPGSASISAAAIQACFGLHWNTTQYRWDYVGASGTAIRSAIETLSQVAAENREPNFFELLKAGILSGSLGRASDNNTMSQTDQKNLEGSKDFHAFQIGLNIIDCAGIDNYPTAVAYADPIGGGASIIVHGVKDLPYLYGILQLALANRTYVSATQEKLNSCSLILIPELFNPHASGGITPSATPSSIRIRVASGTVPNVYSNAVGLIGSLARTGLNINLATSTTSIVVPSSVLGNFRSAMKPVRNGEATSNTTMNTLVGTPAIAVADSDINAFLYYTYTGLPETYNTVPSSWSPRSALTNLLIVLEYQDAALNWHIYDTLTGNEGLLASGTGVGGTFDFDPPMSPVPSGTVPQNTFTGANGALKIDPRSTRFGLSTPLGGVSAASTPIAGWNGQRALLPFGTVGTVLATHIFYPGNWLSGNKTGWTAATYADNIADTDGTVRPADGWLGGSFFSNLATTTATTGRPVILHRPYRSVAELGYVFRGNPWKTLNFFDNTSADGALLDLFAVSDEPPVVAGRIELNSAQASMQQALLSGVGQATDGTSPLPVSVSSAIATAYHSYAYNVGTGSVTTSMPMNLAQIPSFMTSASLTSAYATAANPIKYYRESVVRALTAGTQTRTWNLLIDVVAQTGRFPTGLTPTSLADFVVEGERRYWLSISIDRYTGKVLDEQLEPVTE